MWLGVLVCYIVEELLLLGLCMFKVVGYVIEICGIFVLVDDLVKLLLLFGMVILCVLVYCFGGVVFCGDLLCVLFGDGSDIYVVDIVVLWL